LIVNKTKVITLLAMLMFSYSVQAEIKANKYFQDNMLIQQDMPITVWGTGKHKEKVTVSLCGTTKTTKVNNLDDWEVVLSPKQASNKPCYLTVNDQTFENIVFGELWIAAGQSNIVFKLKQTDTYQEFENYSDSKLRLLRHEMQVPLQGKYKAKHFLKSNENDFFSYQWQPSQAKAKSQAQFSAVGWHFGRELRQALDVPVGVIQLAVGGSSMAEWMRLKTLQANPETKGVVNDWPIHDMVSAAHYKRFKKSFNPEFTLDNYEKYSGDVRHLTEPSFLFDAGVKALKKVAFRGVVWYQGESNSGRPQDFQLLFPMLVKDWREHFNNSEFPFYYVQLPSFKAKTWPQVRAAQEQALKNIPNSEMVVTLDLGANKNIHPKDKQPIGERLANLALSQTYGRQILWQSPRPIGHKVKSNQLVLTYAHVGKGLKSSAKHIKGFEVFTEKEGFQPYLARLTAQDTIILSELPTDATKLRYAYKPFAKAEITLTNSAGLPAAPFQLTLNK